MHLILRKKKTLIGDFSYIAHLSVWLRLPHDLLPQLANLARDDHGTIGVVRVTAIQLH